MSVGAISQECRAVLAELAAPWRGRAVYVAGSGNFTLERLLAARGVEEIHGHDMSLYSCYVGWFLAGRTVRIEVQDDRYIATINERLAETTHRVRNRAVALMLILDVYEEQQQHD